VHRHSDADIAAGVRPTKAQRRYLARGLGEPGGKLPLFDRDGREVPRKTVEACIAHGWAEPWTKTRSSRLGFVCRLTRAGYSSGPRPAKVIVPLRQGDINQPAEHVTAKPGPLPGVARPPANIRGSQVQNVCALSA
jgi:hypothetical protein